MEQQTPILGLCFFENQLFYAVSSAEKNKLSRIGSFDFSINLEQTLQEKDRTAHIQGVLQTLNRLKEEYHVQRLRILSFPSLECWTTVPKIVYDNAGEREKHVNILMNSEDRKNIQLTWYNLSNQDYKFLLLRNRQALKGLQSLTAEIPTADLISDFEIGMRWNQHANPGGSFLTVGCFGNCISVCSYILGKLRGATYITFDDIEDLPYLWLQYTKELTWLQGLHENIYVYGIQAYRVVEILKPFWDDAGNVIKMDSLDKMNIEADEKTYGFNLEHAFPAAMLALDAGN